MAREKAKQAKRESKRPTAYLTKRNLVRAINKGARSLSEEAMELQGYIVIVENGWVVKKYKSGKMERISKLPKRPNRIILG